MRYTTVVSEADRSVWTFDLIGTSSAVNDGASITDSVRQMIRVESEGPLTHRVQHEGWPTHWAGRHRTECAEFIEVVGLLAARCSCSAVLRIPLDAHDDAVGTTHPGGDNVMINKAEFEALRAQVDRLLDLVQWLVNHTVTTNEYAETKEQLATTVTMLADMRGRGTL